EVPLPLIIRTVTGQLTSQSEVIAHSLGAMASAAPTWETVYERNSVERIKRDKPPLGIRDELPALIAAGYERMPEEEIVRLQWWGLYHDKPKIGTFMLRVKIPSGILTPAKL